ncbi:putative TonB-dependent receptor [hydrothermal vent metagenome]|uniref:Putative TonB-dependent receptor n=1 Tax=hydrothermal vent metagenome TaxID=652676 RepID=A0A3B0URT7_9ZZZZ
MVIKRALITLPVAFAVTAALIILMVALIEFSDSPMDKEKRTKLPDIFMPETDLMTNREVQKPEKPKVDEQPPPEIPQQDFDNMDADSQIGAINAPDSMTADLDLSIGTGLSASDGEFLPIVKVAPQYPSRASARGIEGHVLLEYTVTKQGTVKDPIVIEADPAKIFNKAAINSALRYKYKPRVVDGVPQDVPGVRTVIRFKLED